MNKIKEIKEKENKKYALELSNIDKIYDNGFQAVFHTSIKVEKGEFIVMVGPSGCGKSTTLRMIAGLEKVTRGNIMMAGEDVTDLDARLRDISMVFQSYALFPHLSVKDNLSFTLKVRKKSRQHIEQQVAWVAKELGLEFYLSRKPKQLSGGQRQRVALGRAIVANPHLFLLDEPLSNLDAKLRGAMRATIKGLHNRLGATTVYVTHDQVEAMTMADRIIVMRDGFIQQIDSPKQVYNYPSSIFVAGFIGTPTINFIEGTIKNKKLTAGKIKLDIPASKLKKVKDGMKVIVGIRPQNASTDLKSKAGEVITGKIVISELLGNETIVTIKDENGNDFRYITKSIDTPKVGESVKVAIDIEKIHIFDPETTFSLTSEINDDSLAALNAWKNATDEIKVRNAIMEKEKRKGVKRSLLYRLIKHIKETRNPSELLAYDNYLKLLDIENEILYKLEDANRLKEVEKVNELKTELTEAKANLSELKSELVIKIKENRMKKKIAEKEEIIRNAEFLKEMKASQSKK